MIKNSVQLIGNLGNDIELKTLDNGKKVCNFSIAESFPTSKKDDDGKTVYETRWHKITVWDGLATKMEKYAIKGKPLIIIGFLDYDEYKSNDKDYKTAKIIAQDVELFMPFDYSLKKNIQTNFDSNFA
jgi:single-strand DNA-binding protein